MKKILIFMFMIILLVGTVSAWEFDNVYNYNSETQTITIDNAFGLPFIGSRIAEVKLNTPIKNRVGIGNDTKVFEFTINSSGSYKDALKLIEYFDIRKDMTSKEIKLDLKYKQDYNITVNDYKEVCIFNKNNQSNDCSKVINGNHQEERHRWIDYIGKDMLEGEITIAGFTNTREGDKIEFIPTWFGERMTEFAIWEANLDLGLEYYYKLDDLVGDMTESIFGIMNGTVGTNLTRIEGKINNSVNGTTFTGGYVDFQDLELEGIDTLSINSWIKSKGGTPTDSILRNGAETLSIALLQRDAGDMSCVINTAGGDRDCLGEVGLNDNNWHMITCVYNSTEIVIYKDGVVNTFCPQNGNINDNSGQDYWIMARAGDLENWNGAVDELGFWNRTISQTEITQLYNGGDGITYGYPISIVINSPEDFFNTTSSSIIFNYTVEDNSIISNHTIEFSNGSSITTINGTDNSTGLNLTLGGWADGIYTYNVTARNQENDFDIVSSTFTVDSNAPIVNITPPFGTLDYWKMGENLTINFTVSDTSLDSCWYSWNKGTRNVTVPCTDTNFTLNVTSILNNSATLYANDTAGNTNSIFRSWNYKIFEISKTYSSSTISGAIEEFKTNFTYNDSFTGISVLLNYNNTNYSMSTSDTGFTREYTKKLTIPSVETLTNKTLYFIFALSNVTGTFYINSEENNQTINSFLIDNCTTYTNTLLNFTMYDEDTLAEINGTIETNLNIYSYNTSNLVNSYNISFDHLTTGSSAICLANITQNYSLAYEIKFYGNDSIYYKKYKTSQRVTINNETLSQNLSLYNLKKTLGYPFKITVVGNLLSPTANRDLLVDVQKQYLAEDLFRSIESSVTDKEGKTIGHLIETSEVYNFIISYYGDTLGTFNNYKVQCTNPSLGQCAITLNLASAIAGIEDFEDYGNIEQVFLLDPATDILYQTFSSTDGESKIVNSLVIRADGYGNTTICNTTSSGTSGTLVCNIPVIYQNTSFFAQTFVDGNLIGSKYFSQGVNTDWKGANIYIGLLMVSSLALLFIGHPITLVIGSILGFTMPILLLFVGGASFATVMGSALYYIGAGIIILIILGRKR